MIDRGGRQAAAEVENLEVDAETFREDIRECQDLRDEGGELRFGADHPAAMGVNGTHVERLHLPRVFECPQRGSPGDGHTKLPDHPCEVFTRMPCTRAASCRRRDSVDRGELFGVVGGDESDVTLDRLAHGRFGLHRPVVDDAIGRHSKTLRQPEFIRGDDFGADAFGMDRREDKRHGIRLVGVEHLRAGPSRRPTPEWITKPSSISSERTRIYDEEGRSPALQQGMKRHVPEREASLRIRLESPL